MEEYAHIAKAASFIGAAFIMGIGIMGPAIAQGLIGSRACENIGKYPESAGDIRVTMLIALALVETGLIFLLLIAGALIVKG